MSVPLTRDDVQKVAMLARLKLSDAELDLFTNQLGQVLEYVKMLNEVDTDTDAIEPMVHVAELRNVFRDDELEKSLSRVESLANAPKTDGQFFLVPPIMEGT